MGLISLYDSVVTFLHVSSMTKVKIIDHDVNIILIYHPALHLP